MLATTDVCFQEGSFLTLALSCHALRSNHSLHATAHGLVSYDEVLRSPPIVLPLAVGDGCRLRLHPPGGALR